MRASTLSCGLLAIRLFGACVGDDDMHACSSDLDCNAFQRCDADQQTCVKADCLNDNECADGEYCFKRQCMTGDFCSGINDVKCGRYACDPSTRTCKTSCVNEYDCRLAGASCVQQQCMPMCTTDSQCNGYRCDQNNLICSNQCQYDRDCATGYVCRIFACDLWDGG
jgi:hypothetical protein